MSHRLKALTSIPRTGCMFLPDGSLFGLKWQMPSANWLKQKSERIAILGSLLHNKLPQNLLAYKQHILLFVCGFQTCQGTVAHLGPTQVRWDGSTWSNSPQVPCWGLDLSVTWFLRPLRVASLAPLSMVVSGQLNFLHGNWLSLESQCRTAGPSSGLTLEPEQCCFCGILLKCVSTANPNSRGRKHRGPRDRGTQVIDAQHGQSQGPEQVIRTHCSCVHCHSCSFVCFPPIGFASVSSDSVTPTLTAAPATPPPSLPRVTTHHSI